MKVDQYQQLARTTAIYPSKVVYPALGLVGECGEVVDKLFYTPYSEGLLQENGDVCWYIANLAYDCGVDLSECFKSDSFRVAQDNYSGPTEMYVELMSNLGRISEAVKKMIRDDDGVLTDSKKKIILGSLYQIYIVLTELVYTVIGEPTLERSAILNVEKLKSRQERDVLKGDGDDR